MAAPRASLSSSKAPVVSLAAARLDDYRDLAHAPHNAKPCIVKAMTIKVDDDSGGAVPAFLHLPPSEASTSASRVAAILLSGAGGGVVGPSSIYLSLADKLASLRTPIPSLRLDYRFPADNEYCDRDVLVAMDELE